MIKVVDTLAYMTDNIKGILFEDDGLKKKIEELTSKLPDKNRDSIFYTLWMLAIIYKSMKRSNLSSIQNYWKKRITWIPISSK